MDHDYDVDQKKQIAGVSTTDTNQESHRLPSQAFELEGECIGRSTIEIDCGQDQDRSELGSSSVSRNKGSERELKRLLGL